MMNKRWITPLCCILSGTTAFVAARRNGATESPTPAVPVNSAAAPAAVRPLVPAVKVVPPAPPPVLPQILPLVQSIDAEADPLARLRLQNEAAAILARASREEVREFFLTTTNEALREWVARRWGEVDPQGLRQHLQSLPPQESSRLRPSLEILKRAMYQGWAHIDPAAALAAAATEAGKKEFNNLLLAAAAQAIADDPARGFELFAKYRGPWIHFHDWKSFRAMWEHQPAAFTREVFARDSESMEFAAIDAAKAWAATDAAGFSAWAVTQFDSGVDGIGRSQLFDILMEHDPDAAGKIFAKSEPSWLRNKMQEQFVSQLAAKDPQQAAQWIGENVSMGRTAAFEAWAEASAKAVGHEQATMLALSLPAGVARDAAARAALFGWATDDVDAAVTWAKSQEISDGEKAPITHIVHTWMKYHSAEASRYIMEHPNLGWSRSNFFNAARTLPFAEAVRLIRSLPDEPAETSLKMLSERLASGTNQVRELAVLPVERQVIAVRAAASEIAFRDPKKAVTWVGALPAGPLRSAGEAELGGR